MIEKSSLQPRFSDMHVWCVCVCVCPIYDMKVEVCWGQKRG